MESQNKRSRSETFFSIIKNLFILLLFLQFAPSAISGLKTVLVDAMYPKVQVGYLNINGPITDSSFYIKKIDDFAKAPDIKALLLRINSPGGYSGSSQVIFNELKRFKKDKPVVALIENVGASGAYYIAAAATTIIASPLSLVGSIGVFMELPNVKDLLESWKVHYRFVQSGAYKTTGSPVKAISEKELEYLQVLSDEQYNQFITDVAESRNIAIADDKQWADGKALTGTQGLKLKLIDQLGSYNDALNEVKKLAKVEKDEEIKLVHAKKVTGFMKYFADEDDFGQDSVSLSDRVATFLSSVYQKITMQQSQPTVIT